MKFLRLDSATWFHEWFSSFPSGWFCLHWNKIPFVVTPHSYTFQSGSKLLWQSHCSLRGLLIPKVSSQYSQAIKYHPSHQSAIYHSVNLLTLCLHDNLIYLLNFYWRLVHLQCCVSARCTAKWISYTYTWTHTLSFSLFLFQDSFPI